MSVSIEVSSAESQTRFKDADRLFRGKQFAEALAVLNDLDRDFPNVKNILYPRAVCLAHLGRHEEALEVCRQLKVEFGDPRAEPLMNEISLKRKSIVEDERAKKENKVVGSVIPEPNVFQLDSSPPPLQDPGDLGFTGFDLGMTTGESGGSLDMSSLDDMFARSPAVNALPKTTPKSNTKVFIGIGLACVAGAIALLIFALQ
ncbi:MAG TPA: tetratricopeptide repeat protein [Candidatus Hydrogenedentes bacterium]|nr:tetratricopeptide repeat protein [Candidatus Hydrogenedentota bacterium]